MRRVLIGAIGVGLAVLVALVTEGHQWDFNFDWLVGRALVDGVNPSLPVEDLAAHTGLNSDIWWAHARLPGAVIFHAAFGWVPWAWSYEVGRLLTVAAAVWLGWLVAKWMGWPVEWTLLAVPFALLAWPLAGILEVSQWAILAVTGMVGITLFSNDSWRAGIPLGLAVTLKVWPWLVIPALWLAGRRRAAYGAAVAFVGVNLAGLAFPHVTMAATLDAFASIAELSHTNLSPVQWLPIWAGPLLGLVVMLGLPRRWRLAATVPVSLASTPVLWPAYLVSLAIPVLLTVSHDLEQLDFGQERPRREAGGRDAPVSV